MKQPFKLAVIALLFSFFAQAQGYDRGSSFNYSGVTAPGRIYRHQPAETEGSPYVLKVFMPAKVGDLSGNAFMRYNAFNDEFEFIDAKNDTLVLNKVEAFKDITFVGTNVKYELANYTNKNGEASSGYLVRLHEKNDYVLYKKQKVNHYEAKAAKSSYDAGSPAKFEAVDDLFFYKTKEREIGEFPSNRKGVLKLYPDKKEKLEAFFKQQNIDFKNESDLIKLIEFLSV